MHYHLLINIVNPSEALKISSSNGFPWTNTRLSWRIFWISLACKVLNSEWGDKYPGLLWVRYVHLTFGIWLKMGQQPIFKLALDWSFNFPQSFSVISSLKTIRLRSKKEFQSKKETLAMSIFPGGTILTGMCRYALHHHQRLIPTPQYQHGGLGESFSKLVQNWLF